MEEKERMNIDSGGRGHDHSHAQEEHTHESECGCGHDHHTHGHHDHDHHGHTHEPAQSDDTPVSLREFTSLITWAALTVPQRWSGRSGNSRGLRWQPSHLQRSS